MFPHCIGAVFTLQRNIAEAHPAAPHQRAGRADAGARLRERGGERQEDADGSGAGVAVAAGGGGEQRGAGQRGRGGGRLQGGPAGQPPRPGRPAAGRPAAGRQLLRGGRRTQRGAGPTLGTGGAPHIVHILTFLLQPPFSNGHQEAGAAAKRSALLSHKLNGTEITAVRQLITGGETPSFFIILDILHRLDISTPNSHDIIITMPGYRESAAFLLRSADELENLLQLQPKL